MENLTEKDFNAINQDTIVIDIESSNVFKLDLKSLNYKNNWFVTITYDEEHLPQPTELIDKNGITWWDEGLRTL